MSKTPKNHRQPWSPADERALQQLARENTPTRVAALKLARTPAAIYSHAQEMGLSLKPTNQRPNKGKRS